MNHKIIFMIYDHKFMFHLIQLAYAKLLATSFSFDTSQKKKEKLRKKNIEEYESLDREKSALPQNGLLSFLR